MRIVCFLFGWLAATALHAEWQVESSTPLGQRSGVAIVSSEVAQDGSRVELNLVKIDRARCALRVVDLANGESVADAVKENSALAGVNGGYFQEDHSPLGLEISNGAEIHPMERSKLLTGVFVTGPRGAALLRTAEFHPRAVNLKKPGAGALQAGPFLVDRTKLVPGLNATRPARRTVLLADKQGVRALLVTGPVTLAALGEILATPDLFPGLKIERALNLDGGSSTALSTDSGLANVSLSEWKSVRNAVLAVPLKNAK